ncbi:MAG TPA: hypothetical protein VMT30_00605 [Candidatus Saccharimonadia bacterium]|nr:hypothetical protein [Candidatus Saccharimonadia bacterium]
MSVATDLRPPGDPGPQRPSHKHQPLWYASVYAAPAISIILLVILAIAALGSSNAPAGTPRHGTALGSDPHSGPTYPAGNAEITHAPTTPPAHAAPQPSDLFPSHPIELPIGAKPGSDAMKAGIVGRQTEWWRHVEYYVSTGQTMPVPPLSARTTEWVEYTNFWASDVPTGTAAGFPLNPYAGIPYAAASVVMRESDPSYPVSRSDGIHTVKVDINQPVTAGDVTPASLGPNSSVRYYLDGKPTVGTLYVLERWEYPINGVPTAFIARKTCPAGSTPATCSPDD